MSHMHLASLRLNSKTDAIFAGYFFFCIHSIFPPFDKNFIAILFIMYGHPIYTAAHKPKKYVVY